MLQAAAETAAWQRDGGAGGSGSVAGQQQPQAAAAAKEEGVAQRRERQRVEQLTLACVAAQKERSALQQILESKVWTGVGGVGWGGRTCVDLNCRGARSYSYSSPHLFEPSPSPRHKSTPQFIFSYPTFY